MEELRYDKGNRICLHGLCNTRACFGLPGDTTRLFCKEHKTTEMVNQTNKKCIVCNNFKSSCNYQGKAASHCWNCKLNGMVIVITTVCEECHLRRPFYNYTGEGKPTHCGTCKTPGMIDTINHDICEKCPTRAYYNFSDQKKPRFCAKHKKPGMINVRSKMCQGCKKHLPYFNNPGETFGLYCNDCKLPGMIDVKNARCEKCKTIRASYNVPGEKRARFCVDCKKPDMVDVVSMLCKNGCGTHDNKTYDGLCYSCYCDLNPDFVRESMRKFKEDMVKEYVKGCFPDYDWRFDRPVPGGSSGRRPDGLLDLKEYAIWYEVDERKHDKSSYKDNEDKRVGEIIGDFRGKTNVLIRFNPDGYEKDGKKIKSPFRWDVVEKRMYLENDEEFVARLSELECSIQHHLENKPQDNRIEYLFY